jgi:hypothetical protein
MIAPRGNLSNLEKCGGVVGLRVQLARARACLILSTNCFASWGEGNFQGGNAPCAQASAMRVAWSGLCARITATRPEAAIFSKTSIFAIDIELSASGRARFMLAIETRCAIVRHSAAP